MTRTIKITSQYIQLCRRDNYVHHFECHKFMMANPEEEIKHYQHISQYVQAPILNPFGCDSYDEVQWNQIFKIATAEGLKAVYLVPWYLSEEGWQDFQKQWDQLPDVTPALCRELTNIQRRLAEELTSGKN